MNFLARFINLSRHLYQYMQVLYTGYTTSTNLFESVQLNISRGESSQRISQNNTYIKHV